MSTIVAQTISNGTVSTSSANVIQGSAKAWVNFNGSGGAVIRASYNVSSVTRNAVGNYTINFTNAMPDANFTVAGTTNGNSQRSWITTLAFATTSSQIKCMTYDGSFQDGPDTTVVFNR